MASRQKKAPAKRRASKTKSSAIGAIRTASKRVLDTSTEQSGKAKVIVYVHGIGNKPTAEILKCQWDEALFGFNLGERSRMSYWVNRVLYPLPTKATCKMADATQDLASSTADAVAIRALAHADEGVEPLLPCLDSLIDGIRAVMYVPDATVRPG